MDRANLTKRKIQGKCVQLQSRQIIYTIYGNLKAKPLIPELVTLNAFESSELSLAALVHVLKGRSCHRLFKRKRLNINMIELTTR